MAAIVRSSKLSTISLTIHNRSGGEQSYALFVGPPEINPLPDQMRLHAIAVARGVVAGSGTAAFIIPYSSPHAICGAVSVGQAIQTKVLDKQEVTLGSKVSGFDEAGTSCLMDVKAGIPFFQPWTGATNDVGGPDAFCIKAVGFTQEEARDYGFVLGLGTAQSTHANGALHTSWVPRPSTIYHIKPSHTYHVVAMQAEINQPKPTTDEGRPETIIDFADHPSHVHLTHGEENKLGIYGVDDLALLKL